MTGTQISSVVYGATHFVFGLERLGKLGNLTRDMAAAIYLYTMDTAFYKIVNALLRDVDRGPLKPYFPYLKLGKPCMSTCDR